jgi:hypothetical protein
VLSLQFVTDALTAGRVDPSVRVPSSRYDRVNAFNAWKRSEAAGRIRIGEGHPRSVTLPTIGQVRIHDDTRRLRRLLRSERTAER